MSPVAAPRILYLDSFAGIAGDMFTASFLDAGLVDPEEIGSVPALLGFSDVAVEVSAVQRAEGRFTHLRVVLPAGHPDADGHHHPYPELVERLEVSTLPARARTFALRVFRHLAEAEADAHGVPLEEVFFHEVGAVDSVVDVAMAGVCVARVAPDRILASPVRLGRGSVWIHHGTYPVPPPASARLVVGMPIAPVPEAIKLPDVELSTPTGLAILKALEPVFVHGWPAGTVLAQGAGAGTTDLGAFPNVFRVALLEETPERPSQAEGSTPGVAQPVTPGAAQPVTQGAAQPVTPGSVARERGTSGASGASGIGSAADALAAEDPSALSHPNGNTSYERDQVVEIRCNVDDQTGERTAWVMEKALALGALDAWVVPLVGKKGRPAQGLVLLVPPTDVPRFADFLLRRTTSYGIRYTSWDRLKLSREEEIRETPRGSVSFSVGRTADGEKVKEKPEFEDLKKIWEEDPDFAP